MKKYYNVEMIAKCLKTKKIMMYVCMYVCLYIEFGVSEIEESQFISKKGLL